MFDRVVALISKPPSERGDIEIDIVLPWLRKRSEILRTGEKSIPVEIIRNCTYEKVFRDHVLIRQGDKGDKFYIVLSGKTSVYIDTVKSDDDPTPEPKDAETKKFLKELLDEVKIKKQSERLKAQKLDRTEFGKFIIIFGPGKAFGELALMSEDAVRNASIISDEETDLLVIDRELFNRTVKEGEEKEYKARKEFIERHPLFCNWTVKFRRLLEMSFRKEIYPFDTTIVKQGAPVVGLHFITSGQAKVLVEPEKQRSQYPKLFDANNNALVKELGKAYMKKEDKVKESVQQAHIRVRRRQGYAAAEKRLAQKYLTLCYVDESEIIGDTELVNNLDTYPFTIVSTTNLEVYVLDQKNIERLIIRKNPYTLELLRNTVESKLKRRWEVRAAKEVFLLKHLINKMEEAKPKKYIPRKRDRRKESKETNPSVLIQDKDMEMGQLVKLYLQDKAPLIDPLVPGSVFYRTKSVDRARKQMSAALRQRSASEVNANPEVRLHRAKWSAKRQARSRRELERLTLGEGHENVKELQRKNEAINRYMAGNEKMKALKDRPYSSGARSGLFIDTSQIQSETDKVFLTEPPELKMDEDEDQKALSMNDIQNHNMYQLVVGMGNLQHERNSTRLKLICDMVNKQNEEHSSSLQNLLKRPKSAPVLATYGESIHQNDDTFDWETSEGALNDLEKRIKSFHAKTETQEELRRQKSRVPELKRFDIKKPDDVPIPGGTVFVQQKTCKYPPGTYVNPAHHQHVRRFMIPKDAYSVASRAVDVFNKMPKNKDPLEDFSNGTASYRMRPLSAAVVSNSGSSQTEIRRTKSAKPRAIAWDRIGLE